MAQAFGQRGINVVRDVQTCPLTGFWLAWVPTHAVASVCWHVVRKFIGTQDTCGGGGRYKGLLGVVVGCQFSCRLVCEDWCGKNWRQQVIQWSIEGLQNGFDNLCFLGFDRFGGSNLIGGPSRLCMKSMQLAYFGRDRVNSLCGHGVRGLVS